MSGNTCCALLHAFGKSTPPSVMFARRPGLHDSVPTGFRHHLIAERRAQTESTGGAKIAEHRARTRNVTGSNYAIFEIVPVGGEVPPSGRVCIRQSQAGF